MNESEDKSKGVPVTLNYKLIYGTDPKLLKPGVEAWLLVKEVTIKVASSSDLPPLPETVAYEVVAVFEYDSQGRVFNQFCREGGVVKCLEAR